MSLDRIIDTGTYTGNGTTQSVAIGWQPALVFIVSTRTGAPSGRAVSFKLADMAGDDYLLCSTAANFDTADGITITSTGFDVGSDAIINNSGTTFHYIAIREGPWVDTGSYVGNGGTTTVTTGRQPSAVFVSQVDGTIEQLWKMASQSGADTVSFVSVASTAQGVTLASTGFSATSAANENTQNYDWIAFYDTVGSTRHFETGSYTGTGGASQSVSLGRQPSFVIIYQEDIGVERIGFKSDTMSGDGYGQLQGNFSFASGFGITLVADGFDAGPDFNTVDEPSFFLAGYV